MRKWRIPSARVNPSTSATEPPRLLERFVAAQHDIYPQTLAELRAGEKHSHWIWFIFPQIAGLGRSATAQLYAIADLQEARAYLGHPVLGPRLHECTEAVLCWTGRRSAQQIFGAVDTLKLRSSMTLFEAAALEGNPFTAILDAFFSGRRDAATLGRL